MARILVVDDEANIRRMISLALQREGYTVDTAADGLEGLEKFGYGSGWELVLLDHRMPGLEGLEVLRKMRRRNLNTRIIVITAFGTVDLAVKAMKEGATDFLRKPFTLDVLRGAVRAATQRLDAQIPDSASTIISYSTLNGYQIESQAQPLERLNGDLIHNLTVRGPGGEATGCSVILPAYLVELVKAHTGCEQMPGGDAFWRGFSEEALANFVWQNAKPPEKPLRVEELTAGLRRWTDAVTSGMR